MSRTFKTAALLAAFILASPVAFADNVKITEKVVVDYSDLDVSRAAGASTLINRLEAASRKVCGKRPLTVRYQQMEDYLRCRSDAVEGAVRRIDAPAVTLAYENAIGRKPVRLASR